MAWKLDSDRPIYTQILEVIQYQIVAGRRLKIGRASCRERVSV